MNTLESLSIDKLEASERTLAMALMILAREVNYRLIQLKRGKRSREKYN